jgi:hypothetical protein
MDGTPAGGAAFGAAFDPPDGRLPEERPETGLAALGAAFLAGFLEAFFAPVLAAFLAEERLALFFFAVFGAAFLVVFVAFFFAAFLAAI